MNNESKLRDAECILTFEDNKLFKLRCFKREGQYVMLYWDTEKVWRSTSYVDFKHIEETYDNDRYFTVRFK